jgi:hypothetical protein
MEISPRRPIALAFRSAVRWAPPHPCPPEEAPSVPDHRPTRPLTWTDPTGIRYEARSKRDGGLRWLTRLDPAGDAEYRAAVQPLAGRIEAALGPEVFAVRARPASDGWRLAPWAPARAAWWRTVRTVIDEAPPRTTFAVADVRDCYGSISAETIAMLLGPEAAHAVSFLRHLQGRGARGLPVGPEPSAILANAVLSEMDRAVRGVHARHVRWVDDLVVWGPRARVERALAVLDDVATGMGLRLHGSKTRLLADRREARAVALGGRDSSIIAAP